MSMTNDKLNGIIARTKHQPTIASSKSEQRHDSVIMSICRVSMRWRKKMYELNITHTHTLIAIYSLFLILIVQT